MEANPNLIQAFQDLRPEDKIINIGCGVAEGTLDFYMIDHASGRNTFDRTTAEAFVAAHPEFRIRETRAIPVLSLDQIVTTHCSGIWPDLLSLDIEGLDYAVLQAAHFDSTRGPKVTGWKPAVTARDSSSGSRPPSGPINTANSAGLGMRALAIPIFA